MSRFYISTHSDKGSSVQTKTGHKMIETHIRGWNIGIRVVGRIDSRGNDCFEVYKTDGSAGTKQKLIKIIH